MFYNKIIKHTNSMSSQLFTRFCGLAAWWPAKTALLRSIFRCQSFYWFGNEAFRVLGWILSCLEGVSWSHRLYSCVNAWTKTDPLCFAFDHCTCILLFYFFFNNHHVAGGSMGSDTQYHILNLTRMDSFCPALDINNTDTSELVL